MLSGPVETNESMEAEGKDWSYESQVTMKEKNSKGHSLMVFFTGYHGTIEVIFFLIQVEFFKKKMLITGKS